MGKVRRYKKKLAKAAAAGTKRDSGELVEHSQRTSDYLELAEELLSLRKDDDKISVCSVVKGVKSISGDDQFKLKKDSKRYLKHAFLLKSRLIFIVVFTFFFVFFNVQLKVWFFSLFFRARKNSKEYWQKKEKVS